MEQNKNYRIVEVHVQRENSTSKEIKYYPQHRVGFLGIKWWVNILPSGGHYTSRRSAEIEISDQISYKLKTTKHIHNISAYEIPAKQAAHPEVL